MNSTTIHDETSGVVIEKTLHAYDHDPVLTGDPFLAAKILALRNDRHGIFGLRPLPGLSAAAGIVVILLLNIVTIVIIAGRENQRVPAQDIISQLRSEYDIDQTQIIDVR